MESGLPGMVRKSRLPQWTWTNKRALGAGYETLGVSGFEQVDGIYCFTIGGGFQRPFKHCLVRPIRA